MVVYVNGLLVQEVLTTGPPSLRFLLHWSRPRPARNTSTSPPPRPPPTRARTRRPVQGDGRHLTPHTSYRHTRSSSRPAPTCPRHLLHRRPLTQWPTTRTTLSLSCRCRHLPLLPSHPQRPSRPPTAKSERSSSAGTRKKRLDWMRKGNDSEFLICIYI